MNDDAVELTFFTNALMRRWYLPLGLALLGLIAGFALAPASTGDEFEAETRVLIRPVTDSVLNSNLRVDQIINEDTESELASSDAVIRAAIDALGDEAPLNLSIDDVDDRLDVNVRTDSQVVVMRYRGATADSAAAVVDAVAASYLDARVATAIAERDRQSNLLATAISSSTTQLTAANLTIDTARRESGALADLQSRLARLEEIVAVGQIQGDENEPTGDPIAVLEVEIAAFQTTISPEALAAAETTKELVGNQIGGFRDELVALSTLEIDGGEIIDHASPGELITTTDRIAFLAIGFLFGLMIGIAAAVMLERALAARRSYEANAARHASPAPVFAPAMAAEAPAVQTPAAAVEAQMPAPSAAPSPAPKPMPAPATTPAPAPAPEPSPTPAPAAVPVMAVPAPNFFDASVDDLAPTPSASSTVDRTPAQAAAPSAAPVVATASAPTAVDQPTHDPVPAAVATGSSPDRNPPPTPPVASGPPPESGGDLPVLADIPKIPRSAQEPVVATEPTSPAATSLRRLALLLLHDVHGLDTPSIAITSARSGEGRTTIATNLACAMQQEGKRVLLVTDAHQQVIAPGVHVLPSGMGVGPDDRAPDDERLRELLAEARELVDIVILDIPALLDDADATRVAAACDRAVLVGVSGKTTRADVDSAARLVEQTGTPVIGLTTTERPSWLARRFDQRSVSG